jgi:hypothetical protein
MAPLPRGHIALHSGNTLLLLRHRYSQERPLQVVHTTTDYQYLISRSHKGAAGMRSVLTFEKVVWIVDARVEW